MSSHVLAHAGVKLCKTIAQNPDKVIVATVVAAPVVIPAAIAGGIIAWLAKP